MVCCRQAGHQPSPEKLANLYEKSLISVKLARDAPRRRLLVTTRAYLTRQAGKLSKA